MRDSWASVCVCACVCACVFVCARALVVIIILILIKYIYYSVLTSKAIQRRCTIKPFKNQSHSVTDRRRVSQTDDECSRQSDTRTDGLTDDVWGIDTYTPI